MKPLAQQPDFAAATQEIDSLNSALAKVEGRRIVIEAQLAGAVSAEDRESTHVAAALKFAATGVVTAPEAGPNLLREEHVLLRQQAEALRNAIKLRGTERDRIAGELSTQACRDVEAKHADLCLRYGDKLRELDALHGEEEAFVRSIEALGYSVNLRHRVLWPDIGRIAENGSRMWHRAREFRGSAK